MGAQLLLIPALFVAICVIFIIIHSCYYRWKLGAILKRKKQAAKVSLVNILQMTNASLMTPAWTQNGQVKSKIKPVLFVSDERSSKLSSSRGSSSVTSSFNPRNPNVLSSDVTLDAPQYLPPPCYEDLYGHGGAVFTFKSRLTPEREVVSSKQSTPNDMVPAYMEQTETPRNSVSSNNSQLHVTHNDISQERRNSSAVLYL